MKRLLMCLCACALMNAMFAIEVDQDELRQAENTPIEFINYTGPHSEIDSLQSIAAIGTALAGAAQHGRAGDINRYAIIHAVDTSVTTGLDADILIIGSGAKVDHITNLRVIIAGYLRAAYGYSAKDAQTIAHFVTVYNAVYRGKLETFQAKYKTVVLQNLTADKVGLALRYDEWQGKTQIVIPLSDQKYSGTLSTIDTSSISDKQVVEKMREQDDKDLATRKDMIDLKERESDAARERADTARQDATAARKDALTKQKEAESVQKDADQSKAAAQQSKQDAEKALKESEDAKKRAAQAEQAAIVAQQQAQKDPNNPKVVAEAEKKQQEAAKAKQTADEKDKAAAEKASNAKKLDQEAAAKQQEAAAKQKEADQADKNAQNKEKEATGEDQFADAKEQEAQRDRKDIAADTRQILEDKRAERKAQDEAVFASSMPRAVLKIIDPTTMQAEVVLLDLRTEKSLKTSSLNTIRGRALIEGTESLIAVAGSKAGNQMITLVSINPRTLEMTKQAAVPVAEQSMLVPADSGCYAVIEQAGKYVLARFDENLEVKARSTVSVLPYTAIRLTEKGLIVQDTANNIRLLNAETLTEALK